MKSYFFILTYFAGGGTEKVFENVSKVINEKIGNSKIYLFVVNGFNSEKYPVEKFVNVIKSSASDMRYGLSFVPSPSKDAKSTASSAYEHKLITEKMSNTIVKIFFIFINASFHKIFSQQHYILLIE